MPQERPDRILYVDDSKYDRELVKDAMAQAPWEFELVLADSRATFERTLHDQGPWDLVLTDFNILGFEGLQVLDAVREVDPGIPVVIVTGTGSEEIAAEALRRGVSDYVLKTPRGIRHLPVTLKGILDRVRLEKARLKAIEEEEATLAILLATLEATADGLLVVDDQQRVIRANRKFYDMWRIPESLRNSRDDADLMACVLDQLEDPDEFVKTVHRLYQDHESVTTHQILFKDGRIFERHSQPQRFGPAAHGRVWSFRDITSRVRSDSALKESEERYRTLVEAAPDAIFISQGGLFVYVNRACLPLFGVPSKDHLMGREVLSFFHADDRVPARAVFDASLGSGPQLAPVEARIPRADGGFRLAEFLGTPIRFLGGQSLQVLCRDITTRKQAEEALRESEENYRRLVESAPDPIFVEVEGIFAYLNPAAQALLGPGNLEGRSILDIVAPQSKAVVEARLARFAETQEALPQVELFVQALDGRLLEVEVTTTPTLFQGIPAARVYLRDVTSQRKAEEALRASEAILRTFFDSAPFQMGVAELEPEGEVVVLSANDSWARLMGVEPEACAGVRVSALGIPEDIQRAWMDHYRRAAETRRAVKFEFEYPIPGKGSSWFSVALAYIGEAVPGRARFSFVMEDITIRKEAAKRLAESEARYRLISESMQDLICLHDPDGRYRYVSPSVRELLGFEPEELIGLDPYTLFHPDDIAAIQGAHQQALDPERGSAFVQYRLRRKDGSYVWMETLTKLILDDEGRVLKLQTSSRDITARREAEEQRQRAERRFRHLIENSADGLILGLPGGKAIYASPAASAILGYTREELEAMPDLYRLIHPEDREPLLERLREEVVASPGVPRTYQVRVQRKDDEWRWLEEVYTNHLDDPSVAAVVVNFRDITDGKMEEILEQDRRAVLELVAQNTPLAQTLAHLALLLEHQRPGMRAALTVVSEGRIRVGAAPSFPEAFREALDGTPIDLGNGSCAEAARSGVPVLAANTATHPSWANRREAARRLKLRCAWSYPVISATGQVLGTLSLYDASPREASAADMELMTMASRLAAVAIEHLQLTEQLAHQAQHDALTGLPNRLLFEDRLRQALGRARRHKHHLAVLYMDLDRFKHINDTLGHGAGDAMLKEAARRLESRTRQSDTLARMGGDEFTLVLTELGDPQDAARVAAKILEAMRDPFLVEGHELFVSASIGISLFPEDGEEPAMLQRCADTALYRAKEKGRDNFQWFAAEMDILAHERMELEGHLRRAVEHNELYLLYQPQFHAEGGLIGFEALMRWRHPVLGTISPARFIPLAEESGLIVGMGAWALREACTQLARWRKAGHRGIRVAVNVSAVQFKRPDWVSTVQKVIEETGISPGSLELEITESLLLQSATETTAHVFQLRDMGVAIAIDDFGTGYSSLSYLHRLPVTTLKIDQSFVRAIGTEIRADREDAPIVRTIITLAHSLGMEVMAEGVETEAQLAFLRNLSCEGIQGFLLGKPMPVEEAEALIKAQKTAAPRKPAAKKAPAGKAPAPKAQAGKPAKAPAKALARKAAPAPKKKAPKPAVKKAVKKASKPARKR